MQSHLRKGLLALAILAGGLSSAAAQDAGPRSAPPVPFPAGPAVLPPGLPPALPPPPAGAAAEPAKEGGEHGKGHVVDVTPPIFDQAHGPEAAHDFGGMAGPLGCPPQFWGFGEYLLLRPRINGLDFATVDPTNDATPTGQVKRVNYDTSSGLRVGVGFRPSNSYWDVSFAYTYLHADGSEDAVAPSGGTLYPLMGRPGVLDNVVSGAASAGLDYHVYDIAAGRLIKLDPDFVLRLQTGVRLANIRTDFNSAYDGGDANQANIYSSTRFTGAGLMVGGQGDWTVGYGLSVFGRARGALMYGDIKNRQLALNNAGATTNADLTDSSTQIIPVAELGVGLSWQYRNLVVSGGYEATNWFNLVDRQLFVDDFSEGRFQRRVSDLSLEGIFLRLGLTF